MDLIEGISNEVLLAFIVTALLVIISMFVVFFNGTEAASSQDQNGVIPDLSEDNQSNENNRPSSNENDDGGGRENTRDSSSNPDVHESTENEVVYNTCTTGNDSTTSSTENLRRRRGSNVNNVENEGTEQSEEGSMVVKVKHNENVRSFNVSWNSTVVELKRLAFSNEMNSGKRVRFVFAGQLLRNDNDPLSTYGVQDNTVVHCVITDPPEQTQPTVDEQEEDLDLSRFLIPLLTAGLILSWYGLIAYKHIFTGSSIAILVFLTGLYLILVYVTAVQ